MKLRQKDNQLCSIRPQTDQEIHCIALEHSLMATFDGELPQLAPPIQNLDCGNTGVLITMTFPSNSSSSTFF